MSDKNKKPEKDEEIEKDDESGIDPQKNLIVVEGKDDKKFIEAYLKHLKHTSITDIIQVFPIGGYTLLGDFAVPIAKVLNARNKVSIIFDANADYKERKKYVENQLKEHVEKQVDEDIRDNRSILKIINIFLFPNNKGNGSLENLLEELTKHENIISCFEKYQQCIEGLGHISPNGDKKAKIYAYQEALGEKGKKAKEADEFKSENWDFEHKEVQRLKEFLEGFAG